MTSRLQQLRSGLAISVLLFGGLVATEYVRAHEERQTLVAARDGRQFGIATYRIVQIGGGLRPDERQLPTTQLRADLLSSEGEILGTFKLTQHWRKETDVDSKLTRQVLRAKRYELNWGTETLNTETNLEKRTFFVEHNGLVLYSGPFGDDVAGPFVQEFESLARLTAAVERDLSAAPTQGEVKCCPLPDCLGPWRYGQGSAYLSSEACGAAIQSANNRCTNKFCWGCCELDPGGCDCICAAGPFFCLCETRGRMCSCSSGF